MERIAERKTRAIDGQPRMPMAMKTFWRLRPMTAMSAMTKSVYGKARNMSARRMMIVSQMPP